jgi:predicted exporter
MQQIRTELQRIWPAALIVAIAVAGVIMLLQHLSLDQRITAFLPHPADPQQALVIDQIGAGSGGRMILAALSGANPQQLAQSSRLLAARWRELPNVERVENGAQELDPETEARLMQLRLLLVDDVQQRLRPAAIDEQLSQRLSEITLGGQQLDAWVRRDPLGILPDLGAKLASSQAPQRFAGVWFDTTNERALMLVMSAHEAFATDAQAALVTAMRQTFKALELADQLTLELAGAPIIAIDSAASTREEATRLSIAGSVFLLLVLMWFWRSAALVISAAIPLTVGILSGLLVTMLSFGQVHGLTLAFGFTLLGLALDYPVHLFAHASGRSLQQAAREISKPLLMGAGSTIIAYLAIWNSASPGLAQLGAFSAAGLAAAALATLLLPRLQLEIPDKPHVRLRRNWSLPWLPAFLAVAACAALYFQGDELWSSDLNRLTPVSDELLMQDKSLRQQLGSGDVRHLLVISAATLEHTLTATEATVQLLSSAQAVGIVNGWQAVTTIIPSQKSQAQRRADWPDAMTMNKLLQAADNPFKPQAFQPFLDDLAALHQNTMIGPDSWQGTLLQTRVDSLLQHMDKGWRSIIVPAGLQDPDALVSLLQQAHSEAYLIDLKATSEAMVSAYRHDASFSMAIAALLIAVLISLRLGNAWLGLRIITAPLAATLCTALVMSQLDQGLTIIHLIGLLLSASIGLDYAIFSMTMTGPDQPRERSNQAIRVCALSSGGVFLILAQSGIGLLHMLGMTVTLGILLSWLFSRLMQPPYPTD